jgi:hypothetical protein
VLRVHIGDGDVGFESVLGIRNRINKQIRVTPVLKMRIGM